MSPSASDSFLALGLDETLVQAVVALGYEEPTPIQRQAIPALLTGRDLLGQAATGTGKTAAFALPLLARLGRKTGEPGASPRALVLVPTRELAMQVAEAIHRYGRGMELRELPIYGGQPMGRQLRALQRGVDVVIATPGRALDHLRRGTLRLDAIEIVILDEADEMLDMGFAEDLEALLQATPSERQTALFSATMPGRITAIARRHQRDPARIQITERPARDDIPLVRQEAYIVARAQKLPALTRILDVEDATGVLIFGRTRLEVHDLAQTLIARGHLADALHGGLSQEQRDRVMRRFRDGATDVLVATDVAARGLDVERLSHVVNYDLPSAPEDYVHRIGRTGRAGREGVAVTLVEPREHRLLRSIEQLTKRKIAVRTLPSVADLRARQLELTCAELRELLIAGDLERYRVVVDSLSGEFDVVDVALAAIRLAHTAAGRERDAAEIPAPKPPPPPRRSAPRGKPGPGSRARPSARARGGDVAQLSLAIGRRDNVRPGDIVGAIANEAGLPGSAIGAIQIGERHSLVEVPAVALAEVLAALDRTRIKGKRAAPRPVAGGPPRRPPGNKRK